MKPITCLLALAFASSLGAAAGPTVVTVTNTVRRPAAEIEPIGLNSWGDAGGEKASNGNLIWLSGFEPAHKRDLHRVIESGKDEKGHWITLDGPGTSNWQLYASGFFSGKRMRAYRFLDAAGQPLPYKEAGWAAGGKILDNTNVAKIKKLFDSTVLPKGTPGLPRGGWLADTTGAATYQEWNALPKEKRDEVAKSWRVYYSADVPLLMDDLVIFETSFIWPDAADFHPRTTEHGIRSQWQAVVGTAQHVALPADAPKEMDGGLGALELTPDQSGGAEAWFKAFGGTGRPDASWYGTLDQGTTYRYEAWVKVVGATEGEITLGFGGNGRGSYKNGFFGTPLGKAFPVTAQWKKVGFEFVAPATPKDGGIEGAILRYAGSGKLLVDNVKLQPVYQPGDADKPFVIYKPQFDAMLASQPATGRKGAHRVFHMLSEASMDSMLNWHGASMITMGTSVEVSANQGHGQTATTPKALTWAEATGNSPETRMVPWLVCQVTHDENEYRQLVEYLAAPYNPATDTPQSKPFAYRRTLHRGHARPWADDFREIIIEFGNENWHNRVMANWLGVGRMGTVFQAGPEMGVFSRHLVEAMRESPFWNEDKIKIVFGGDYSAGVKPDGSVTGYGQEAVQKGGDTADYHGHATYVGPRWEKGESSETAIDDNGVQKTLFGYRPILIQEWQKQAEAHVALRKLGYNVRMVAYEGGPSGFGLRAKSVEEKRAGEYYGKSYAMSTAMIDAWIDAWSKGWTYQLYYSFGQGEMWPSHTSKANGFRPSPGFLTASLLNQTFVNRDLLTVTVTDSPVSSVSMTPQGSKTAQTYEVPTVQAHAAGGGDEYTVALSNLNLTETTPVAIKLPLRSASRITLHTLQGDPRDTNLEELKVTSLTRELDAAQLKDGTFTMTLPAGRFAIVVFKK